MIAQSYENTHWPLALRPSSRVRTRLGQRALIAAHCVEQSRTQKSYVASLLHVSLRSLRRGQQLLRDGNPELIDQVLNGQLTLYEAITVLADAETIAHALTSGGVRGTAL
jgi:hypothetical protein